MDVIKEYLQAVIDKPRILREASYLLAHSSVTTSISRSLETLDLEMDFDDPLRVSTSALEAWTEYQSEFLANSEKVKDLYTEPLVHLVLALFHHRKPLYKQLPDNEIINPTIFVMRSLGRVEINITYILGKPYHESNHFYV